MIVPSNQGTSSILQKKKSVKHPPIEYKSFTHIRKLLFNINNMKDLFENINKDELVSFLRETRLSPQKCKCEPDQYHAR